MISVKDASQLFKKNLNLLPVVTGVNVIADRDYPPFDRVMMDGIAVKFADIENGLKEFSILGIQPAGSESQTLNVRGHCFEVMTGAPLPHGADLVIPYEHLEVKDQHALIVKDLPRVRMENIHLRGSDCLKGEVVLKAGEVLNGPHQGIAASMGVELKASTESKILIISTGDELVEVHETPLDHQIRRSNAHALKRSLELNGFRNVTLAHLKDDPQAVADHYSQQAPYVDVMIYSGGVSKGKFDYLPNVWLDMGVKKHFHEVSQRPGKPLWFGTDEKLKTTVIGLPGNPVSSLVCLHRYVIPGRAVFARLTKEVVFKKDLTYFLPAKLHFSEDGVLLATPMNIKNSGEFTALAGSDGFIELPAEKSIFAKDEAYPFWCWRNIL